MRRFVISISLVLALVAMGACSSDSKKSTPPPAPNTGSTSADVCKLLSDSDVSAATGAGLAGVPMDNSNAGAPNGTPIRVGCTWGELASGSPVIGVQIGSKNGGTNDLMAGLISSTGPSTTVDVGGASGQLLTKALLPRGGGQGKSIVIKRGDKTVVIGLTQAGETPVDEAKLVAAAEAVNKNLA